jgi:hypothetical protein
MKEFVVNMNIRMLFLGMPRLELPSDVGNTRQFKSSGICRLFTGGEFDKLVLYEAS